MYQLPNATSPVPPDAPATPNWAERVKQAEQRVFPYLKAQAKFQSDQLTALRQVPDWFRYNQHLVATADPLVYTYQARIRLVPNLMSGVPEPQALLVKNGDVVDYDPTNPPPSGKWTLVTEQPSPTDQIAQQIILGDAPAPGDVIRLGVVEIQ